MAAALRTIASQNFLTSSSGSFPQICSGFLFRVSANDTHTGTFSFSKRRSFVGCRRLLASSLEIVHDGVWKGSRFLFQINWLFMEIVLPTLDQFKPSFKNGLFSFQRSCILHFSCQFSFSFLSPRRVSPVFAWGDFHARSRFACSTTPEEKWETTRSLWFFASDQFLSLRWITLWTNVYFQAKTIH